ASTRDVPSGIFRVARILPSHGCHGSPGVLHFPLEYRVTSFAVLTRGALLPGGGPSSAHLKGESVMRRNFFRLVAVVTMLLAVNFVLLPTAEARSLSGSRPAVHNTTDWFDAALAWMADLLGLGHATRPAAPAHLSGASSTGGTTGGIKYVPTTG